MAETKGKTRGIRISDRLLIAMAVLIGITLLAAVFVVPGYGKVFKDFTAAAKEYHAADKELKAANQENTELTSKVKEMREIAKESEDLSAEVFELAAQTEQDILDGKSNKKICYITLDDGPYNRGKKFLEVFAKYDIKATFFLTTANGDKLPDQADLSAKSMYNEYLRYGHTIGNHTYSHNYREGGIYSSTKAFMKSVNDQQTFTKRATGGYTPKIVRFPGGSAMAGSNYDAIAEELRKEGLVWVDWTVDSGDSWGSDKASASLVKKNIRKAAEDQKIMVILFHEWSQPSLEAMPTIIEYLDKKGYIFLPLFPESSVVEK